ncbi:MAG: (d)CMP kinase [Anaerolineales bacterium]|nr:(d)CMP kinase [Anaerolineales bacterium]
MALPKIIAVDGPAASGKSTLGKRVAESLGYLYFDTGVMYRAITWVALRSGTEISDELAITALANNTPIDIEPPTIDDGRGYDVMVQGQDITWEIRRPDVDANVSVVSAYPGVRRALSAQQRRIGMRGKVVMVGRDIGTVVLPEADLKIFLDASAEERARRRYLEQKLKDETVEYQRILESVQKRDRIDSSREVAPLRPADDAVIIDSDEINADQVYSQVLALVRACQVDE